MAATHEHFSFKTITNVLKRKFLCNFGLQPIRVVSLSLLLLHDIFVHKDHSMPKLSFVALYKEGLIITFLAARNQFCCSESASISFPSNASSSPSLGIISSFSGDLVYQLCVTLGINLALPTDSPTCLQALRALTTLHSKEVQPLSCIKRHEGKRKFSVSNLASRKVENWIQTA